METVTTEHKTSKYTQQSDRKCDAAVTPSVGEWIKCSNSDGSKHSAVKTGTTQWFVVTVCRECEINCVRACEWPTVLGGGVRGRQIKKRKETQKVEKP